MGVLCQLRITQKSARSRSTLKWSRKRQLRKNVSEADDSAQRLNGNTGNITVHYTKSEIENTGVKGTKKRIDS